MCFEVEVKGGEIGGDKWREDGKKERLRMEVGGSEKGFGKRNGEEQGKENETSRRGH